MERHQKIKNQNKKEKTTMKNTVNTVPVTLQPEVTVQMIGRRTRSHCKPVMCITTGQLFASCSDAAEYFGVIPSTISDLCHGRLKSLKGMEFMYIPNSADKIVAAANAISSTVPAPVFEEKKVPAKSAKTVVKVEVAKEPEIKVSVGFFRKLFGRLIKA
jgi:hypothetical protein